MGEHTVYIHYFHPLWKLARSTVSAILVHFFKTAHRLQLLDFFSSQNPLLPPPFRKAAKMNPTTCPKAPRLKKAVLHRPLPNGSEPTSSQMTIHRPTCPEAPRLKKAALHRPLSDGSDPFPVKPPSDEQEGEHSEDASASTGPQSSGNDHEGERGSKKEGSS